MHLMLRSGRRVTLAPQIDVSGLTIDDVAWGLSQLPRFLGQLRVPSVSVAEHSVRVSRLCPPEYALLGLLHDAHEAVIGDMPTPLKRLPEYQLAHRYEYQVQWHVLQHFLGRSVVLPPEVHAADVAALRLEIAGYAVAPDDAECWGAYAGPAQTLEYPRTQQQAYLYFLERYEELTR